MSERTATSDAANDAALARALSRFQRANNFGGVGCSRPAEAISSRVNLRTRNTSAPSALRQRRLGRLTPIELETIMIGRATLAA